MPRFNTLRTNPSMLNLSLVDLVDEHTTEDEIEVFSTELGLDWISGHNFLTCLQKLSSYTSGHLKVSELAASPSQTDTLETDKNECASLLKDPLSHLGYSVGRDDIINIVSLRKLSSLEVHTLSLSTKSKP
ncbi:hypothetical protein Tco_1117403 [Tanacetum coccineum]